MDARNVKAARHELMERGWLTCVSATQTALNRWGLPVVINLLHDFANVRPIHKSPPPTVFSTAQLPPPMVNKKLSSRDQNQKLDFVRDVGVQKDQTKEPNLRKITLVDLRDPQRLDGLYRQAVQAGIASGSPAGRLQWFAAAERALELGTRNPCGFFVSLVHRNLWHHITNAQEDAARKKLNRLDYETVQSIDVQGCSGAQRVISEANLASKIIGEVLAKPMPSRADPAHPIRAMISEALAKSMAA